MGRGIPLLANSRGSVDAHRHASIGEATGRCPVIVNGIVLAIPVRRHVVRDPMFPQITRDRLSSSLRQAEVVLDAASAIRISLHLN